jgi:NTE family protein
MFPLSQMKIALVLSGGGMFGAYQAGAWKALSRLFTPDIVVGTSVGALNGWYIASGTTAEELERHWLDPAAGDVMTYRFPRAPWNGVFDPRPLERRARLLVENQKLQVDYGVALLRLPRLQRALFRNGEVTWRHLVAACAVPVGFPPVRIAGRLYCDGGLLEPTPVWAAAAMGATRVIAVNASRFIPPPGIGTIIKGLRMLGRRSVPADLANVVMITPKEPLGKMLEGAVWRRENTRRWIEMGEADAIAAAEAVFA